VSATRERSSKPYNSCTIFLATCDIPTVPQCAILLATCDIPSISQTLILQDHDQSYKYWPELSQVFRIADLLVETSTEKIMGGYVMREISVRNSKVGHI